MAQAYAEELVYIQSEDGLPLEGLVIQPNRPAPGALPLLFVHGLTGKFYSPTVVRIGRELAARGYTFVSGNNRGHDFGYPFRRSPNDQPTIYGGGWELFSQSPRDVGAWVTFVAGLGFDGLALLGHSLGARKVVYYQSEREDRRVRGLMTASPPIRSGITRPELVAQAEAMVAAGKANDLLPWGISPAGGGTLSAASYLDRSRHGTDLFGVQSRDAAIGRIRAPLLAFFGTDEASVGGAAELAIIRANATGAARVETHLFEGPDHSYTGHHAAVGERLASWLATLS